VSRGTFGRYRMNASIDQRGVGKVGLAFGAAKKRTVAVKGRGATGTIQRSALATPHAPIPTLTAVVSLAIVLLLVVMLTACGETTTSDTQPPPTLAPAPSAAAPPPAALMSEGKFTGRTSDNKMTLAINIKGDRATGYLCDGKKVEAWLEGTVSGGQVDLRGKTGATATGALSADAIFGTVTIDSEQSPYSAEIAEKPAGLYEGRGNVNGVANRIGWIVLPDGS
jgi:hypothetical protein